MKIAHESGDLYFYSKDYPVSQFMLRGYSSNIFVLDQGDELWMFDCGIKAFGRHKRFLNQLRKDGLKPEKIGKIIFTHGHPDHINAVDFFKENFNPEIILPTKEKERFLGGYEYEIMEIIKDAKKFNLEASEILPAPPKIILSTGNYSMGKMPEVKPDRLINDGDLIKGSKYSIKAISTPGHTKGHTCYYIEDLLSMVVGDLIDPYRDNKSPLNYADVDYDEYMDSLNKMLSYEMELFMAMHAHRVRFGTVVNQIIVNMALLHMDEEKEKVIAFLKENSNNGSTIKDFKNLYPVGKYYELTDSKSFPFVVIKSLFKDNLIKQVGNRFFLKEEN